MNKLALASVTFFFPGMHRAEEAATENTDKYSSCPLVAGHFASCFSCIVCQKESITPLPGKEDCTVKCCAVARKGPPSTQSKTTNSVENLTASVKIMLKRHGLIDFQETVPEEVPRTSRRNTESRVEIYQAFLNCTNLTGSGPIFRTLDLDVFYLAFRCNFKDQVFMRFVERLQRDPLTYSKDDKSQILYVLIFAAVYCAKNKVDSKRLGKKIGECSFLFKRTFHFDLPLVGDSLVDRFIAQMKSISADFGEATFLNGVYLGVSKNREMLGIFHRRLLESLALVDNKHLFSFLKHVFTQRTVLFSCISFDQVIKLMVSFYSSAKKVEHVFEILTTLFDKIDDEKIHGFLASEIVKLNLKKPKYLRTTLTIEVRSFGSLEEFRGFFARNRNSCSALSVGMDELRLIKEFVVRDEQVLELLETVLSLFSSLNPEFLEGFLNRVLSLVLELIPKVRNFGEKFVAFNQNNWNLLSDLILVAQRIGLGKQEVKKKIGGVGTSEAIRMGVRLAEMLYQVEDKAEKSGLVSIVRLKKRGFRFQ